MNRLSEYYRRRKIFKLIALVCIAMFVISMFVESHAAALALSFIGIIIMSAAYSYMCKSSCKICGEKLLNLWDRSFGMAVFFVPKSCDNCEKNS